MKTTVWDKAPSVCGPKQYFFTQVDPEGARWWICWDFAYGWCAHNNQSRDRAYFDSVAKAKKWYEDNIKPTFA